MSFDPLGLIILNKLKDACESEQRKYLLNAVPEKRRPGNDKAALYVKDILNSTELCLFGESCVRNKRYSYYENVCFIESYYKGDRREIHITLCSAKSTTTGLTGTRFNSLSDEQKGILFPPVE